MASDTGIEYYPFNVDFFDDDKIALIEGEFGIKGPLIAIQLLCKIYREGGYYYQWGNDECLLFSRKAGTGIVPGTVQEVVKGLVRRSFFDKGVYDQFNVLTSRGIQQRYLDAVRRRQKVEVRRELLLVDVSKYPNVHLIDGRRKPGKKTIDTPEQKPANREQDTPPSAKPDRLTREIRAMHGSPIWIENVAIRFRLTVGQVAARLDEFAIDCRSRGTQGHDTIQDAQRHFNDWLRIQLNSNNNTSNNGTDRKTTTDKRRATKAATAKTEDFKTSF